MEHGPYVDGVQTERIVVPCLGYIDHLAPADERLTLYKLNDALANVRAMWRGRVDGDKVNHEDLIARGFGLEPKE
jgi:hypothetical protein